ncbi:hypothetical protein SKAU_G00019490 [Synaphobranchus kaupii]|uniref:Uncharacterized protein n=1 Tax=Synaphobranchus kaupii TaxID=118154 RepID=A0A9Q1GCU3_SYNKA|nr:hypothetical protein SKAU_G00019490 [Synaphobranchus kaupii]
MADIKFLPSIVPAGKGALHPWYKERLCIKCRKGTGLDARGWRFLKPGLDDFRSGYPPPVRKQNFIWIQGGVSPASGCETKPRKCLTKELVCFSKENPQQQARRKHIAEVEYTLTQHPLALYPHFQECMSPELLDQIVSVLDPEMSINSEAASFPININKEQAEDYAEQYKKSMQDVSKSNGGINTMPSAKVRADVSRVKNPYLHLRIKESSSKDDQGVNGKCMESPSLDEEIKRVTKQLHDWVVSLDDDLTESTLFNLLANAFEVKPSLNFPKIHNLPKEQWSSVEDLSKTAKPNTFLKAPDSLKK